MFSKYVIFKKGHLNKRAGVWTPMDTMDPSLGTHRTEQLTGIPTGDGAQNSHGPRMKFDINGNGNYLMGMGRHGSIPAHLCRYTGHTTVNAGDAGEHPPY